MNKDELKDITPNNDAERIISPLLGLFLFIICLVISQQVLPEDCPLYETRQLGFLCDGFDPGNPKPCLVCDNPSGVLIAQIVFGLGVVLLFFPFVFSVIKNRRNRLVEQTKLFD